MKTSILISGFFLLSSVTLMAGGGMDSGGGTAAAAEFREFGFNATKIIRQLRSFPVSAEVFEKTVMVTHIEFTNELLRDKNGHEVDALNFPHKKLIRVHYPRWLYLWLSQERKFQLVVHEYLGVLGVDDQDYKFSQMILTGGVRLVSLTCKYEISNELEGLISFYQIDIDHDGQIDSSIANVYIRSSGDETVILQMPVLVMLSERKKEIGYSLSWTGMANMTAFIPAKVYEKSGSFKEDYYSLTRFKENGMPAFKKEGVLACQIQKN